MLERLLWEGKKIPFSQLERQPEVEKGKELYLNFSRAGREKAVHPGLGNYENVVSLGSCCKEKPPECCPGARLQLCYPEKAANGNYSALSGACPLPDSWFLAPRLCYHPKIGS